MGHTIENVIFAASSGGSGKVILTAIIHKLGAIRKNKREILLIDETGKCF